MATYEERVENYIKFKDVAYYVIIAVVSFVSVAFLPFLSSAVEGGFEWPQTPVEWLIWAGAKVLVSVINVMIFHSYMAQAKINVKEHPNYLLGLEIMGKVQKSKNLKPRSPRKFFGKAWGTKGTTLFISTLASTVILTEALLRFDLVSFLTYIFTVFLATVFGYFQMRTTEDYWTSEFLAYANGELAKIEKQQNSSEVK